MCWVTLCGFYGDVQVSTEQEKEEEGEGGEQEGVVSLQQSRETLNLLLCLCTEQERGALQQTHGGGGIRRRSGRCAARRPPGAVPQRSCGARGPTQLLREDRHHLLVPVIALRWWRSLLFEQLWLCPLLVRVKQLWLCPLIALLEPMMGLPC